MADEAVHGGRAIRRHLVDALYADAIGPYGGREAQETSAEVLSSPPSRWYLTGFLAPLGDRDPEDATADEELAAGNDLDEEETSGGVEPEAKQKKQFPASMGLSVLLPPADPSAPLDTIEARVSFAEYVPDHPADADGKKQRRRVWRRVPRPAIVEVLPLDRAALDEGVRLREAPGIRLCGKLDVVVGAEAQGLRTGTRALSLFLVNERGEGDPRERDRQFLFQVELGARYARGIEPRPNRTGELADQWDENVADLQFRERVEYAVGHNVSVRAMPPEEIDGEPRVTEVRTEWIPEAEVPRVRTRSLGAEVDESRRVETRMRALASAAEEPSALRAALEALPREYAAWIEAQRGVLLDSREREQTRDALMGRAEHAKRRIAEGVELLATDPIARRAFALMNRAMAMAGEQQGRPDPSWRLFQLAFVLLNVRGTVEPTHADREIVELIFFPTGGGKTEAYLGLVAFTVLLRRLRHQGDAHAGLGVAVLLRYTLRLLTLDQLRRAATLVCALELLRREDPKALGAERFAVGLWVGRSATANTLDEVVEKIRSHQQGRAGSPFPLPVCPWCGHELEPDGFDVRPTRERPEEVRVLCTNIGECSFEGDPAGLPVLFVDEQIYRELPCFLVATVDKFAMMPWRGEVGLLFGRAVAREGERFFGPMDKLPKKAPKSMTALPPVDGAGGLLPPELIVQDELHLISGPLGTMVGLYETTIEALSTRTIAGKSVRPKIVASTATVRRAEHQVRALFGRSRLALFPPPGVDENETFFSEVDRESPGRLYVGFAAPGRPLKQLLIHAYVDLLAAAEKMRIGPHAESADAYLTLTGYFNALRELGGMRRLVEDQVLRYTASRTTRWPEDTGGSNRWFANRTIGLPVELTSREPTDRIKESKRRLELPHAAGEGIDVLLASNMISVGIDIERLGLMVVAGQPKTTSEYIQASSRVGRRAEWPGLVVTCFNLVKPRDRSHYERFAAYHESFYRFVEAQSLTPFSQPALERGLAGSLVALARLLHPELTPPRAAMDITKHRAAIEAVANELARRAEVATPADQAEESQRRVAARTKTLLDAWEQLVASAKEGGVVRTYSPYDREKADKVMLRTALEEDPHEDTDAAKFVAPTSMRDVEESSHFWLVASLPVPWRRKS